MSVLDPDVALVSDGGGVVRAARRPVVGADKVARFLLRTIAKAEPSSHFELVRVNGLAGFAVFEAGRIASVVALTVADGRVGRLDLVRAPGKLRASPADL